MIYTEEHWHTLDRSDRFQFVFELAMFIANAQSQGKAPIGEESWDIVKPNFKSVYARAKYLYCDARAIRDPEHIKFIQDYKINFYEAHQDHGQYDELVEVASGWVANHLTIGDNLQLIPMSSTRNALLEFLQKNNKRQVRIHQQEYWNKTHLNHYSVEPTYFEDPAQISDNDCVLLTLPLHGTYSVPEWVDDLFEKCSNNGVPVFIDCCWAWLQHKFHLDLIHDCIDTVTCTMGKLFPIEGYRNGFKFVKKSKVAKYDMLYSTNRLGNRFLIDIMRRFPADHVVKKYTQPQQFWSSRLKLNIGNSVHNLKGADDLLWYSEHRMLANDGVDQMVFNIVPLLENHDLLIDYSGNQEGSS